jgi:lipopolysaccharide transport system permease protein
MYATPVIYPLSIVSERFRWALLINPMTGIFEVIRFGLYGTGTLHWMMIGYSTVFTLVLLMIGVLVFNKVEKNFVDTV